MSLQVGISGQTQQKLRFIYDTEVYHETSSASLVTALDISGKGQALVFKPLVPSSEDHYLKITIDGNIVIDDRKMSNYNEMGVPYGVYNFNSTFKVEHRSSSGSNTVKLLICYCKS